MAEKHIIISPETMKAIARYETTFRHIPGYYAGCKIELEEKFSYGIDDLLAAMEHLRREDPEVRDLLADWLTPLMANSTIEDLPKGGPFGDAEFPGLIVHGGEYVLLAMGSMRELRGVPHPDWPLSSCFDVNAVIADLKRFIDRRNKPILEWDLTPEEMENYVARFDFEEGDEDRTETATETALELCRRCLDVLCPLESEIALRVRGYACYGDSRLYKCDWETSRKCFEKLFKLTEDPQYANTLGYIYYYGRCNNRVPQYEDAFRCFSYGAANTYYESTYKLGDMYANGYACAKSPKTAFHLYLSVYDDCLDRFLAGEDTTFADAALRLAGAYHRGIGVDADPETAMRFYLQAWYAIQRRADRNDYGDAKVRGSIRKGIEEVRQLLIPLNGDQRIPETMPVPSLFHALLARNYPCELTFRQHKDGSGVLKAKRLPTRSVPEPEYYLFTDADRMACALTREISYKMPDPVVKFAGDAKKVRFDYCWFNEKDGCVDFYLYDEVVAKVWASDFQLAVPKAWRYA